jgi:hypothetical protein
VDDIEGAITMKKYFVLSILFLFMAFGCSSSDFDNDETNESKDCSSLEPENPYSPGTGHYAGFEWAEQNDPGYCDGNSNSFIEGCEEYQRQSGAYDECTN